MAKKSSKKTSPSPSTHGSNGGQRGNGGRFGQGNQFGQGNPLAGRAAKIRATLLEEFTPADAKVVARKLIDMAKTGDLGAIRELLDRTMGKPAQAVDLTSQGQALTFTLAVAKPDADNQDTSEAS